jgi:hypothetical protein
MFEQTVDEMLFPPQAGEKGQIDGLGDAHLPSFLDGQTTDEAIFPSLAVKKPLHLSRGADEIPHRRTRLV